MDSTIRAGVTDLWSADSKVQNKAFLSETEADLNYRKKYASLWKSR